MSRLSGRTLLLAAALAAGLVIPGAASADPPGDGSAASPYLISSVADLDAARASINADTAHAGAAIAHYKLTADLDYAKASWTGIDWFGGTFDGAGHTIDNLKYATDGYAATLPGGTAAPGSDLGLFRVLDGATVENLGLKDVNATTTTANASVGGVSVWSFASAIKGVALSAPAISATGGGGGSYVGGLVALAYANTFADRTSTVSDGQLSTFTENLVSGGSIADANRTGGIVGMATGPTTVSDNSVNTTLSNPAHPVDGTGGQANTYYYVIGGLVGEVGASYTLAAGGQANGVSMTANAIAGTIKGSAAGSRSNAAGQNFASATVGYATTAAFPGTGTTGPVASNWTTASNVVDAGIQYTNETGTGLPGADGTSVTTQALATQSTYTGLGWNFGSATTGWAWNGTPASGSPVPAVAFYLTQGGSPTAGWQVGAAQERLQFQVADPSITSTLQDFPVQVQLKPAAFDYANADKDHLQFTMDADASAKALPYEVEHWDPSGTSTIWVKVPALTATAQTLDLYYDGAPANATNQTAVWDSGFITVNHFNGADAGTILDSTSHGYNGTPWNNGAAANLLTFGAAGQNSPAIAANAGEINFGTDVGADDTGANSFHDGATYSVAFYVPASDVGAGSYDIVGGRDLGGGAEPGEQFSLVLQNGISSSVGSTTVFVPRVSIFKPATSSLDNTLNPNNTGSSPRLWVPATAGWHDLTLTYDNATIRFYVDGVLGGSYADAGVIPSLADYKVSTTLPVAANGTLQPFVLDGYSNSTGNGTFTYDDMQLSNQARSADWVHAQYLAQTGGIATAAPASQSQSGGVTLAVTTPADGGTTAATFTLAGYVSEQSTVSYHLDGGAAVSLGQESGAFSAPLAGLAAGPHTLIVTADAADHSSATKTVSFTVDVAGPVITINAPTDGQRLTSSQSITVDVSASDPAGIGSTTIKLDGQTVQNGQTIAASSLPGGQHTFVVTSTDRVGNSSTRSITFSTPGSITIAHPAALFQAAGAAPGQAAILSALGAALPSGASGSLAVSGFANVLTGATPADWYAKPGMYSVTVSDPAAADGIDPVTARVEIVPVSVVTVAHADVYFNAAAPPTAASILSAAGAKLTDGNGDTVSGSLAVAGVGSSTATITGTDMYGFATAPVTVAVHVSPAVVAVAHGSVTFAKTSSAPAQAALIQALGATVTGSADGTPVVDAAKVDWGVPGTYTVTVSDSDANDKAAAVTATIHVTVAPTPVVTLPALTVYLPVSASNPLPPALLLANSGATLTDLDGNPLGGTLSADTSKVDGAVAGTYAATITGTDANGDHADPVTVTVVIYLPGTVAGVPAILGTPAVGATLSVDLGTWAPSGFATYQWLRDGVAIAGAVGATYQLTAADAGRTIQVRVTESPQWYAPATATSAGVLVPGTPSTGTGTVLGTVPATLSLTLGGPATFGSFVPGVAKTYDATMTATVTSSATDAALSVSDPSATAPGHLVNGGRALASPLQMAASRAGQALGAYASAPATLLSYDGPVSNDAATLAFKQAIAADEPLLTGSYGKTLTFTLSTTAP